MPCKKGKIELDYAIVNDTPQDQALKDITQNTVESNAPIAPSGDEKGFPLALARSGELLRIAAFKTGKGLGKRLGSLGLRKGSLVQVALRQKNGSVVVSHENNRVALGAAAAQMIIVTLCAPQADK